MPVNKERVRKFVAALRSGEFEQGREVLGRPGPNGKDEFCCLGVACEVAIADGLELNKVVRMAAYEYGPHGERYSLPMEVSDWYGFTRLNPTLDADFVPANATAANDSMGLDFNQIADLFEKTYLNNETESANDPGQGTDSTAG